MKNETCNGLMVVPDSADRVILEKFLHVGDRVVMAVPSSDEGYHKRAVQNGVVGTVIGFKRYTEYVGRNRIHTVPAGMYERNGRAIVKWDMRPTSAVSYTV